MHPSYVSYYMLSIQIFYVDSRLSIFSASTLLVGHQEEHRACEVMRCWHCYLSGAKCKWFAYGPSDATAIPLFLASLESKMVLPFWYQITQVVLEKRPLNGCSILLIFNKMKNFSFASCGRCLLCLLRWKEPKIVQLLVVKYPGWKHSYFSDCLYQHH